MICRKADKAESFKKGRALSVLGLICLLCSGGCASSYYAVQPPAAVQQSDSVVFIDAVPLIEQEAYQCGPAALASVLNYWGDPVEAGLIVDYFNAGNFKGVMPFMLSQYATDRNFWVETRTQENPASLRDWLRRGIPVIALIQSTPLNLPVYHFVVVRGFNEADDLYYLNAGREKLEAMARNIFAKRWDRAGNIGLIVVPPQRVDWPLDVEAAKSLAWMLDQQGGQEQAIAWYRHVLEREADPQVRFNLANVLIQKQDYAGAKRELEALHAEAPGNTAVLNNLAWVHLREGAPGQTIKIIEEGLARGADESYALIDTLAGAHCSLGDREQASRLYREALTLCRDSHAEGCRQISANRRECSLGD